MNKVCIIIVTRRDSLETLEILLADVIVYKNASVQDIGPAKVDKYGKFDGVRFVVLLFTFLFCYIKNQSTLMF